jgi:gamma-glutamylcysteine synthetase
MSERNDRLNDLKTTTQEYVQKEKTRIDAEVKILQAILDGRTSGAGAQVSNTKVAAVAFNDLAAYIAGED